MHILSLDPATKLGWARFNASNGELASGRLTLDKELGDFDQGYRRWLLEQIKGHEITHVILEKPIMPVGQTQMGTLIKLYGLNMSTHGIARALRVPVQEVQVSTWRKHFLGNGRPANPKKASKDKCAERGWKVGDDNEAEALGILDYARSVMDPNYAVNSTPLFAETG